MKKAALKCIKAESNGALMRHIPLAIWCRNLPENEISKIVYSECELTHPNPKCKVVNFAYSLMIKYIFEGDTRENCFKRMKEFLFNQDNFSTVFEESVKPCSKDFKADAVRDEILSWIELIDSAEKIDRTHIGHVKLAFLFTLYIFLQNKNYEESLKTMLYFGGDTDTNSAIMGGMVGAFVGASNIPEEFIQKVLECDPSVKTLAPLRDKFLVPKYMIQQVFTNLLSKCPKKL